MNTDGTGFHTCKECHKTECLSNHTAADRKEGEQLEDRRSVGEGSCDCGDGTDRGVHSLMFMMMMMVMMMMMMMMNLCIKLVNY
jgi:ABC-type Na+ efflux pump permease subunit